jgi:hypothetical protein
LEDLGGKAVYFRGKDAKGPDFGGGSLFFPVGDIQEVFYMISDVHIPVKVCYSQGDELVLQESMCQTVNSRAILLPRSLPGSESVLRMFEIPAAYLIFDSVWKPFVYIESGDGTKVFYAGVKKRAELYVEESFAVTGMIHVFNV